MYARPLLVASLVFIVFLPQIIWSIAITEVMYNPLGLDTNREWIEIYNNDNSEYNTSSLKLRTDETDHRLTGAIIKPGGYAVIVQNITKFLEDYSNYAGIIIDSSFSLANSKPEIIVLKNSTIVFDNVTYSIVNEGNSSCLSVSFVECFPTPGKQNIVSAEKGIVEETARQTERIKNQSSGQNLEKNETVPIEFSIVNPESVFIDVSFDVTIKINPTGNFSVHSYVYRNNTPVSKGFNGSVWKGSWDANKINILGSGETKLKLVIENGTEPGIYSLRVKINGEEITKRIVVESKPKLIITNSTFVSTDCAACKILVLGPGVSAFTNNFTINATGSFRFVLMKGQTIIASENLNIKEQKNFTRLPPSIYILLLLKDHFKLFRLF